MKISGCRKLSLRPLTGCWFRALNLKYWKTRLLTDHTRIVPSRFSAATKTNPLYRILSLGENHLVAMFEVRALLGDPEDPVSNPKGSYVLMNLNIELFHIANLCVPDQQRLIGTDEQALTGNWRNKRSIVPTQKLGAALHAVPDLEGVIYPSSKVGSKCLAIFMDKLDTKSLIEFHNEDINHPEKLV